MPWYAAHLVMMVEIKGEKQNHFPVWENVVLINSGSEDQAFRDAEARGREDEGDDGNFRWGGIPASWVFAGVRKLTECPIFGDKPEAGDEITFTEFDFKTKQDVERFAGGKSVEVLVNDKYAAARPEDTSSEKKPSGKREPKRKPA